MKKCVILGVACCFAITALAATPVKWSAGSHAQIQWLLKPRVAVFDADGTLWPGDVQEGLLEWLIKHHKLQVKNPQTVLSHYQHLCHQSKRRCYGYAVQAMQGLSVKNLNHWAAQYFAQYIQPTLYASQVKLIRQLKSHGWHVWIVSASSYWAVLPAAKAFHIPKQHIIGMQTAVKEGRLTDQLLPPITYRHGKVAAIKKWIGVQPTLVMGNSMTDYEMLRYSRGLSVVINPQSLALKQAAKRNAWIVEHWQ